MEKGNVYYIVIIFLIVFFAGVYFFLYFYIQVNSENECNVDADCVPASCCHAEACVPKSQKPNCTDIFCTQECKSSLDCGAGYCGCVKNKCEVVLNE